MFSPASLSSFSSVAAPLSAAELSSLLLFATAMAFTPGPNTTLAAALAANHGLRHAMRFVLAVPLPLMLLYGLASNFTYAVAGSALRGWLALGQRLLWFNRMLALVLLATAVWMARL